MRRVKRSPPGATPTSSERPGSFQEMYGQTAKRQDVHVHLQNHLNLTIQPPTKINPLFTLVRTMGRSKTDSKCTSSDRRPAGVSPLDSQFHTRKIYDLPEHYSVPCTMTREHSSAPTCKDCLKGGSLRGSAYSTPSPHECIACANMEKHESWRPRKVSGSIGFNLGRNNGERPGVGRAGIISQSIPTLTKGYNNRLEIIVEPNDRLDDTASTKSVSAASDHFTDCDFQLEVRKAKVAVTLTKKVVGAVTSYPTSAMYRYVAIAVLAEQFPK